MMKYCQVLLIAAIVCAPLLHAQRPNPAVQKDAMKKLAFLEGKWSGDASVTMGPGEPRKLRQTEEIQYKLDGLVLVVEGTGRDPQTGKVEFNAFATIAYDEATKTYRFRAYNNGNYLDTELKVRERGLEWGYTSGPLVVKNVMELDEKGEWFEYTDAVFNNSPPRRTVEIRVRKNP